MLAAGGVDAHRVEFTTTRPRSDYLALFNRIDIGLDPVPCPGHTTTLDALYMGVPVVHLPGGTAISRGGASILHTAGLDDWIASSEDDFVARGFVMRKACRLWQCFDWGFAICFSDRR